MTRRWSDRVEHKLFWDYKGLSARRVYARGKRNEFESFRRLSF
jgi:hypothetical protein